MSETIGKREDGKAFEEWFASWIERNGMYYTEGEVECRHIQLRAAFDAGMERVRKVRVSAATTTSSR